MRLFPNLDAARKRGARSHWRSNHAVCEDCPRSRKILNHVGLVFSWVAGIGVAAFFLWFSPTIYHGVAEWSRIYRACIETQPKAATLGDFLEARVFCSRRAGIVMRGR